MRIFRCLSEVSEQKGGADSQDERETEGKEPDT
jgi:hypothetical protein